MSAFFVCWMNRQKRKYSNDMSNLSNLLYSMRACAVCENLPLGPKPIFQIDANAPILIVGQAPGRLTHAKGIPFDDPSGNRLRHWLGVTREEFTIQQISLSFRWAFAFPAQRKAAICHPAPNAHRFGAAKS